MEWERPLGIAMLFFFSLLGLAVFDDKKLKVVSFFIGVTSAITLWGWSNEVLFNAQQFFRSVGNTVNPDSVGIATSAVGLSLSPIIPSKSIRRTAQTASISGLTMSLLGLPSWILWLIMGIIAISFIIGLYFIAKKVAKWLTTIIRGD
ncbi:MAG: hypothetical protein QMD23_03780 [Candidatus Bathyarchaeia archaeon]|nr:hypothetical protein [Candidatus Bathyarchaeia archaeon]